MLHGKIFLFFRKRVFILIRNYIKRRSKYRITHFREIISRIYTPQIVYSQHERNYSQISGGRTKERVYCRVLMFLVEATQRIMKIARIRKWFVPRNSFQNPGRNFSVRDTRCRSVPIRFIHSFIQDHVRIPWKSVKIYKDLNSSAHLWIKDRGEDLASIILRSVRVYANTLYSKNLFIYLFIYLETEKERRKSNKLW